MRRFAIAVDRIDGDRVTFDRDESHHIARVLRLRDGDTVIAIDGVGRELTVRLDRVADVASGTVVDVSEARSQPPVRITLVQGVPKGERMEMIVRAATELGVARVCPAITERTVVRLDAGRWEERARRWQRVAREAAKQSRRAIVPTVDPPRAFAACLDALAGASPFKLCLWEGDAVPLRSLFPVAGPVSDVHVVIGPEGGLTSAEVEAARLRGFLVASLGHGVLRTETAGPATIAIVQWELGGLGG
jgi:16S rRNA (uracil1498-N3)-methyltransferase